MNEVIGLRLAYQGFVAGLAGGYVWVAIAMALAAIVHGDPLRPLEPLALALSPFAESREAAFVLGLGAVQVGGAVIGMCFAYFFARFFTVRATLAVAAPTAAVLAWALIAALLARDMPGVDLAAPVALMATIGYGLMLGARVPIRGAVVRHHPGPPTR
ncbi:MAG: hypothetical protein H0U86_03960 [Chloroflexi bacterium]|nr:hypothetical protein [Chloroflexota bacterium]